MIVIVDYGMGNLASIQNMIKAAGGEIGITSRQEEIEKAVKLILPGVGAFDAGMQQLSKRGLIPLLNKKVLEQKTPILGICLGMQLFTRRSEEGTLPGLGWIDGETVRFKKVNEKMRIPHMGWNTVRVIKSQPCLEGLEAEPRFYFVHSYHVICEEPEIFGKTHHGYDFPSIISKENILGVQFHPEKSHKFGMQLFQNFFKQK